MEAEGSSKLDRAEADEGLRDGKEVEDDELEAALEHGGAAAGRSREARWRSWHGEVAGEVRA